MKHKSIFWFILNLFLLVMMPACKKDDCESCASENSKPRARAGADQRILLQMEGILEGNSSYDLNVDITAYKWAVISGPPNANIDNANAPQTFVRFSQTGVYQIELQVTNANGIRSTDTLQISVESLTAESICNRPVVKAKLVPIGRLPGPKADMKTTAVANKIFLTGGRTPSYSGSVDIYDINTNSWTSALLSDETLRSEIALTTLGNKVFFAGGSHYWSEFYTSIVDIYDAGTNSWYNAKLSKDRMGIAAAAAGNKVVFAGGGYFSELLPTGFETVDIVDIYDNSSNSWTTTRLKEGRMFMTAITKGDSIYFSGGTTSSFGASARIDIYNAKSNKWSELTMKIPGTKMEGIVDQNNLFLVGGYRLDGSNANKFAEILDLTTGNSILECMVAKNGQTPVKSGDNLIFFTGNAGPNDLRTGSVFEIYNTKTKQWSVGILNRAIHSAGIIAVNNIIYVAGGIDANGKISDMFWKLEF